ncbi:MAG: hypothetical protein MJ191_07085, partial [Clostridium sp.]|nr:hypothetical protein [Clostridium sp.]
MGKYDSEYSKYYNSMTNKSKAQGPYRNMNTGYKKKNNIFRQCSEYCIFQCIVTLIVLVTVLAMKYSNDTKSVEAFNSFKENVNERSSYSEIIDDIKHLKLSNIRIGV